MKYSNIPIVKQIRYPSQSRLNGEVYKKALIMLVLLYIHTNVRLDQTYKVKLCTKLKI